MPARSRAQLRAAYAAASRGESWGKEMVAKTPRKTRSRLMKRGPARVSGKPVKRGKRHG